MHLPRMAWKKRYRIFSGWGMVAGKVEVLLVIGGFDVDGGAEARLVNISVLHILIPKFLEVEKTKLFYLE
jgi:hypothetical protein